MTRRLSVMMMEKASCRRRLPLATLPPPRAEPPHRHSSRWGRDWGCHLRPLSARSVSCKGPTVAGQMAQGGGEGVAGGQYLPVRPLAGLRGSALFVADATEGGRRKKRQRWKGGL